MSDLRPVGFETSYTDFGEGYVKDGIKTTEWEAPDGSIWHDPSDYHLCRELGDFDFNPETYDGDLEDLSEEELEAYNKCHAKAETQEGHSHLLAITPEPSKYEWEDLLDWDSEYNHDEDEYGELNNVWIPRKMLYRPENTQQKENR